MISSCLAPSTIRTYSPGIRRYAEFCDRYHLERFPLREEVLENFCTSLFHSLGYRSIKVYLCGIQLWSRLASFPEDISQMERLHYVLRGIRRLQGNSHTRPQRTPITLSSLSHLHACAEVGQSVYDSRLLQAATSLAFFGLLRVSEFCAPASNTYDPDCQLLVQDVVVNVSAQVVTVHLRASKSDPFRIGVDIRVGAITGPLCPVRAMARFLFLRGQAPGPLFTLRNGQFLTRQYLVRFLRRWLPLERTINTHSFRRGGATALAANGVPQYVIQGLGRWKSMAFLKYIDLADPAIVNSFAQFA